MGVAQAGILKLDFRDKTIKIEKKKKRSEVGLSLLYRDTKILIGNIAAFLQATVASLLKPVQYGQVLLTDTKVQLLIF